MYYINFDASTNYITRDAVSFRHPVNAKTFLTRFAKGESCSFDGSIVALSSMYANHYVRSEVVRLAAGRGRLAALADLDAFFYFEFGSI